jgi:hypothetical protein
MNAFLFFAQTPETLGFFHVLLVGLVSVGGYLAVFKQAKFGWMLCTIAVVLFALDLFGLI